METNVPNFDGMSEQELIEFANKYDVCPSDLAADIFPDRPVWYISAAHSLAEYAYHKAHAMNYRKKGQINDALYFEKKCDEIYNQLPEYARW